MLKHKRKLMMTAAIAGMSALMLAGCGGAKPVANGSGNMLPPVDIGSPGVEAPSVDDANVPHFIDVGKFSLELPGGWKAFPQVDMFADPDEDGTYPVDESMIFVSNQAEEDAELLTKPYIAFDYSEEAASDQADRNLYENVADLADVSIAGASVADAFTGDVSMSGSEWSYQIITLEYANGQMVITIPTVANSTATGLSWENPGIRTMIESVMIN